MAARLLTLAICAVVTFGSMLPASSVGAELPAIPLRIGVGDDSFGVAHVTTPGLLPQPTRVKQASDLGAGWDRFPIYWADVQQSQGGPYNFSRYDAVVAADLAAGIKVQAILLGYPKWDGGDFLADWERFVREAVGRYKGKIAVWEVWNEPDLKDDRGAGIFWKGSPADYYALLKTAYRAAKAVDPSVTILLAGLSFTWNNQDWFPRFLDTLAADTSAPANNYYFDALALHQYGRPSTLFDLPVGYVGKPSFAGFHGLMRAKGFDKPIWVNEVGVAIWNTGSGQNGPGRATIDEAANFVVQSFAYGFAAGVERIVFFQLYDDGASSIDPATKKPADYYGLIANDGQPRSTYRAYQQAVDRFSGAKMVSRVNLNRKEGSGQKGQDAITFWGTSEGKVTAVWNNVGGKPADVAIPATSDRAKLYDKYGNAREVVPAGGMYRLTLAGATNNNNFGCISGKCEPEDYIIGGETQILVEPDRQVPAVMIEPIGPGVIAPFAVSWRPVAGGTALTYDVQVQDTSEGIWRDWIVGSPQTTAFYGDRADLPARFERTYLFRVRARDRDGKVVGMGYPLNALASTTVLGGKVADPSTGPAVPAKPTFFPVADEFGRFYDTHDGPRILGRAISPAFAPGGIGRAQYFEKGRLEDHSAETTDSNWRFQYGLLVDELQTAKADLPIGGDASTLTYAGVADAAKSGRRVAPPSGYSGNVLERPDGSAFIPFSTNLAPAPGHLVPAQFWRYLNRTELFPGGWLHDIGLPISEPLNATVTKGPQTGRKIVVQAFQRTILTFDPLNPADWQVERANVGTDYRRAFPGRVPQ